MSTTISSRTDIETYVDNHYGITDPAARDAAVQFIQSSDHPPYGLDWSEYLSDDLYSDVLESIGAIG
jgi:hypothetical protein